MNNGEIELVRLALHSGTLCYQRYALRHGEERQALFKERWAGAGKTFAETFPYVRYKQTLYLLPKDLLVVDSVAVSPHSPNWNLLLLFTATSVDLRSRNSEV